MTESKEETKAKATKQRILVSNTVSDADRQLQHCDLKQHLAQRGKSIGGVEVEYIDDGPNTPERNQRIQDWINENPDGAKYRNRILTPCAGIAAPWRKQVKTKTKKTTKAGKK